MDFLSAKHVIGFKQTLINLAADNCDAVIVATDCDTTFKERIIGSCKGKTVKVLQCYTRQELGKIMRIDVPCGVVAILKC